MSVLGLEGNNAGSGDVDCPLGSVYLPDTFLYSFEVVDIFCCRLSFTDKETSVQRGKMRHTTVSSTA